MGGAQAGRHQRAPPGPVAWNPYTSSRNEVEERVTERRWIGVDDVARVGDRIHVIGNSCSGKSTLAAQLAELLDLPLVELDALNWLPGWVGLNRHDPDELDRRIRDATGGDRWIVAGSYTDHSQRCFWGRLETLIWLDLPLRILVPRVLARSWRRSRAPEPTWGGNREHFWGHLAVWRGEDSLLWWIVTQHGRKRRQMLELPGVSRWGHVTLLRVRSVAEADALRRKLGARVA